MSTRAEAGRTIENRRIPPLIQAVFEVSPLSDTPHCRTPPQSMDDTCRVILFLFRGRPHLLEPTMFGLSDLIFSVRLYL